MLYTLNLYSAISQLYLNKAGKQYYVLLNYSLINKCEKIHTGTMKMTRV